MKYKLTDESIEVDGVTLFRIQALGPLPRVKVGEKGGFIEKESNLSQEGISWIYDDAYVFGDAHVWGNAWIFGKARVYGSARVYGGACVYGNAHVFGNAHISDNAAVSGKARVYGDSVISEGHVTWNISVMQK
jgi:UDP-3-O-[3-hydroxymyristoyl] glucosamine N-acyltransferase